MNELDDGRDVRDVHLRLLQEENAKLRHKLHEAEKILEFGEEQKYELRKSNAIAFEKHNNETR